MKTKVLNFTTIIEQDEDGVFVASVPAVPGCHTQGDTYEEAIVNVKDALQLCLDEAKSNSDYASKIDFPKEDSQEKFIGFANIQVRLAF